MSFRVIVHTTLNQYRRALGVTTCALLVATVGACGTSDTASPPTSPSGGTSASSSTAASRTSTAPSAPSIPATVPAPGAGIDGFEGALRRGPGTVYTGCDPTISTGEKMEFSAGQVFVPSTGKNVPRQLPTFPPGTELTAGQCLVAGEKDHLRVIYIASVRTPSSGLNPESTVTQIISYDPATPGKPVAESVWPADMAVGDFDKLMPTPYGFIAHGRGGVVGFDLDTLNVAWRTDDTPDSDGVNFEGYVVWTSKAPDLGDNEYRMIFHSAKDGAEVGSVNGPLDIGWAPRGFFSKRGTYAQWERVFFDLRTAQAKGPLPSDGQFWGHEYMAYNRLDDPFIRVWDLDTMQMTFERQGQDVEGLNIENVYLAGNYLYIANDADSPVIDLTTAEKVSSNWKTRPIEFINDDWVMVIDGHVTNDYATCFDQTEYYCYEDAKLAHAPGGNYPGPWF